MHILSGGLFMVLSTFSWTLRAQSVWELKKDKDNIRIYTRSVSDSKFNELKAVFDLSGDFVALRNVLQDIPHFKDWVYATKSSSLVERVSDEEMIYYSEVSAPWPLSNRDFYGDTRIWIDSAHTQLRIASRISDRAYPVRKGLVRIPFLRAEWVVSKISPLLMHVEYTLSWNPGGSIPSCVANLFSTTGPFESFSNLKRKMMLVGH